MTVTNPKLLAPLLIVIAIVLLYFKTIFQGLLPIPSDLLVGAYYPWLESKYGYTAGVPIKNPAISDVFSQFYPWKLLVAESWRHFRLPLWNPYSYSGYPLLATLHSGAYYPLNLLLLVSNHPGVGWSVFLFSASLASALALYLLLRTYQLPSYAAAVGSITYALSGFAVTWMQFATAAHSMIWLPLMVLCQEKYYQTGHRRYLKYLPFLIFMSVTSGHFQTTLYTLMVAVFYHIWRCRFHRLGRLIAALALGLLLSSAQLLPSFELLSLSIRTSEKYIQQSNFGLLPPGQLATIVAPDYFGTPVRGNHWGFSQYHESLFYSGVLAFFSLIFGLLNYHRLGFAKFFIWLALFSLLFAFDNPISRLIYNFNLPLLSTSYASRILVIFTFAVAVLTARVSTLLNISFPKKLPALASLVLFLLTIASAALASYLYLGAIPLIDPQAVSQLVVTLRNLVVPFALVISLSAILIAAPPRILPLLLFAFVSADLLWFAHRYLPFTSPTLLFPATPHIEYLQQHLGSYRMIAERGELLPANTWIPYRLRTPIGYDPLSIKDYYFTFDTPVNRRILDNPSRYLQSEEYPADILGQYAVKYLLTLKKTATAEIPGDLINYRVDQRQWEKVFETPAVAVLQNRQVKPRARLTVPDSQAQIITDLPELIEITYTASSAAELILADTWYPGWTAKVGNTVIPISRSHYPFRSVPIKPGSGMVTFTYLPVSFVAGLNLSLLAAAISLIVFRTTKNPA